MKKLFASRTHTVSRSCKKARSRTCTRIGMERGNEKKYGQLWSEGSRNKDMPILLNCAARTNYLTVVSNVRMFFEQLSNAMPTSVRADDI